MVAAKLKICFFFRKKISLIFLLCSIRALCVREPMVICYLIFSPYFFDSLTLSSFPAFIQFLWLCGWHGRVLYTSFISTALIVCVESEYRVMNSFFHLRHRIKWWDCAKMCFKFHSIVPDSSISEWIIWTRISHYSLIILKKKTIQRAWLSTWLTDDLKISLWTQKKHYRYNIYHAYLLLFNNFFSYT